MYEKSAWVVKTDPNSCPAFMFTLTTALFINIGMGPYLCSTAMKSYF